MLNKIRAIITGMAVVCLTLFFMNTSGVIAMGNGASVFVSLTGLVSFSLTLRLWLWPDSLTEDE